MLEFAFNKITRISPGLSQHFRKSYFYKPALDCCPCQIGKNMTVQGVLQKKTVLNDFAKFTGKQSIEAATEVFYKKNCSIKFPNIQEKTAVLESLFYRVEG